MIDCNQSFLSLQFQADAAAVYILEKDDVLGTHISTFDGDIFLLCLQPNYAKDFERIDGDAFLIKYYI